MTTGEAILIAVAVWIFGPATVLCLSWLVYEWWTGEKGWPERLRWRADERRCEQNAAEFPGLWSFPADGPFVAELDEIRGLPEVRR